MKKLYTLIILVSLINFVYAVDTNLTDTNTQENALTCMNQSLKIMQSMTEEKFNVQRLNDSINQAVSYYNSQELLMKNKNKYDFLTVIKYCEDIKKIKDLAISSRDDFFVLKKYYNSTIYSGVDTKDIDKTIKEIEDEFSSERYENVDPLITKAYGQIESAVSSYSRLNVAYKSTLGGSMRFIYSNRYLLIGIVIVIILFWVFFWKKAKIKIIKRKIEALELRKSTIRSLISKTQKDYFERGDLSEGNYNIRTKKFGELILDIERQIPLLNEELAKLKKKK